MKIKAQLNNRSLKKIAKALESVGSKRKIRNETATILNETAKKATRQVLQIVTQELDLTQKRVRQDVKPGRATAKSLFVRLRIKHAKRIPIRDFKAKPVFKTKNKKKLPAGIEYKVNKAKGKQFIPNAFMVPRWDNQVYARANANRWSLRKLQGASPWGAFLRQKGKKQVRDTTRAELKKQLERRINFIILDIKTKAK